MPARTTREVARARVMQVFSEALDRVIPPDGVIPLKGSTFLDFENQVETLVRDVAPTLLEERAALESHALVEGGGRCPFCGSERVYLSKGSMASELQSPHGGVIVPQQRCRCRACDRSFSPSGA